MYPTVIIILVALNRSHMEIGFPKTDDLESRLRRGGALPLRSLTMAVTVDAGATGRLGCDTQPHRKLETMLVMSGQAADLAASGETGLGLGGDAGLGGRKPDVII